MSNLNNVELRLAYEFTCEECGRDTFIRPIAVGEEEQQELQEEFKELTANFELPDTLKGNYSMIPTEVSCRHCDSKFQVILPR